MLRDHVIRDVATHEQVLSLLLRDVAEGRVDRLVRRRVCGAIRSIRLELVFPIGHEVRVAALVSSRNRAIRATQSERRLWISDIIVRDFKLIDPCQFLEFVEISILFLLNLNSMVDHVVQLALFHAPALLAPNVLGTRLRLKLLSLILLDSSEDHL